MAFHSVRSALTYLDSATWQSGRFGACEVFVAIRCQAVESVNYRVHRLATVATKFAKWRCPVIV